MDVCAKLADVRTKSAFSSGRSGGEELFHPWACGRKGQECPREIRTKKFMFMLFSLPRKKRTPNQNITRTVPKNFLNNSRVLPNKRRALRLIAPESPPNILCLCCFSFLSSSSFLCPIHVSCCFVFFFVLLLLPPCLQLQQHKLAYREKASLRLP